MRDDQPRAETCRQIALAIRDEVLDLEAAGMPAIQIDEPALREGLPLRRADWAAYLRWAVDCFRLAPPAACGRDPDPHPHVLLGVQRHHAGDRRAWTRTSSRSRPRGRTWSCSAAFGDFAYPNEIGPGVYDIHSPRVPGVDEIVALLRRAAEVVPADRLWVNPDCGLKTRGWSEVEPAVAQHGRRRSYPAHRGKAGGRGGERLTATQAGPVTAASFRT